MKDRRTRMLWVALATSAMLFPLALIAQTQAASWSREDIQQLRRQRFARDNAAVLQALSRQVKVSSLGNVERFMHCYYAGDWEHIREILASLSGDNGQRVYQRMLQRMTSRGRPFMTRSDLIGLIDASPAAHTSDDLQKLGVIVKGTLEAEEAGRFIGLLEKGIRTMGGKDARKRTAAGRLLLIIGLRDEALAFLPSTEQIKSIKNVSVRTELLKLLADEKDRKLAEQQETVERWRAAFAELKGADLNDREVQDPLKRVFASLGALPTEVYERDLAPFLKDKSKALAFLGTFGAKAAETIGQREPARRTANVKATRKLLNVLSAQYDLTKAPWAAMVSVLAQNWIRECRTATSRHIATVRLARAYSREEQMLYSRRKRENEFHVHIEVLIANAPEGEWFQALPKDQQLRVKIGLARGIATTDQYERAVNIVREVSKGDPHLAVQLADYYIQVWADKHDPNLPGSLVKKLRLGPNDSRISLTRSMQRRYIAELSGVLKLLHELKVYPENTDGIVRAFDTCYSNAEAYTEADVELVFGPVERMKEKLLRHVVSRMRTALAAKWRSLDVQAASLTKRTQDGTFQMVSDGYDTLTRMCSKWLKKHPDSWDVASFTGSVYCDWADYVYFQGLATTTPGQRVERFKAKNHEAMAFFEKAAAAYEKRAAKAAADPSIEVYQRWFDGLMGIGAASEVNLKKALHDKDLDKIRASLKRLPAEASQEHMDLFSAYVTESVSGEKPRVGSELRYKFLSSALKITGENPFAGTVSKKIEYYEELLSEVRLGVTIDGNTTVGLNQDLGIFVSVVHTPDMGREGRFGRYLADTRKHGKSRVPNLADRREELEKTMREVLSDGFEVKAVVFSEPDVAPRKTKDPAWEETILCYVLMKPKDVSVDKVPSLTMDLDFIERSGPVTLSIESAPVSISVTPVARTPRPCTDIEITSILDNRGLRDGELALEVQARGNGLLPDLDDLLRLQGLNVDVTDVEVLEKNAIKEVNSWAPRMAAVSGRSWKVHLAGEQVKGRRVEFQFPAAKSKDVVIQNKAYEDQDLVEVGDSLLLAVGVPVVGQIESAGDLFQGTHLWIAAAAGGVCALALMFLLLRRRGGGDEEQIRAENVFAMPTELDAFVVVQLLRRIRNSELVKLTEKQAGAIRDEIDRLQRACFSSEASSVPEDELRSIARKWLKVAR